MDLLQGVLAYQSLSKDTENVLSKVLPCAQILRQHSLIIASGVTLSYILLCRCLRFRRVNSLRRRLEYTSWLSLRGMTNTDAHAIIKIMAQLEFPLMFKQSLSFALFKTYGIPTISSLLVDTRMFSTPENASRRYEDTSLLIGEFLIHSPREQRSADAIARMNYLHGPYIKAGKISNDDLLYTLSVFITEPISWINRFEWRQLTDFEVCALGTFWKSVGDAMSIDYNPLRHDSWETGIDFYNDIKEWAQLYEARVMTPCHTNKTTADELVSLLLYYVPQLTLGFAHGAIGTLMGDRLKWAMSFPEPSLATSSITLSILAIRQFLLRHVALPRIYPVTEFTPKDPQTGRYHHTTYLVHPYYVKATFRNRWGPSACMTRLLGGIVPGGKEGPKYHPEGYTMVEVGPDKKRGQGGCELVKLSQAAQQARPLGCPFHVKEL